MAYNILVRDNTSLEYIGELDDWQSLTLIPTFNDVGTWQLALDSGVASHKGLMTFASGIVVFRNGKEILSGPITQPSRQWDSSGDVLTLSGVDDNVWLQRRLALPTPNSTAYGSVFDVRNGAAETVMKQYVSFNAGLSAMSQRQIPGLSLEPDQGRGVSISGSARFDNLLTLLQNLALAGGGLGFKVIQAEGGLQFQVYEPTDKTATAIFSPLLGNMLSYQYLQTAPAANYIIGGSGSTDSSSLFFSEAGDSDSISTYGRIEGYYDDSGASDTAQLAQDVQSQLAQSAQQTSLTITPIDTGALQFIRDYYVGDKVSVAIPLIGGEVDEIQDILRSVNLTVTSDGGEVISPTVGTPDTLAADVPKIFQKLSRFETRLSRVERRR